MYATHRRGRTGGEGDGVAVMSQQHVEDTGLEGWLGWGGSGSMQKMGQQR